MSYTLHLLYTAGNSLLTTDVLNEMAFISDMTRVHVKMRGGGIALKGSALRATDVEPGDMQIGLLGFITSELPRGACALAGASGLCSSSALALYKFRYGFLLFGR